jgi:hypothetical protein
MEDLNAQFQVTYDHYQELINIGDFDGDMYDKVDGIMNVIWSSEDAAGAYFDQLESDIDKRQYIEDFKNACQWLISWNHEFSDDDYRFVAERVINERIKR